MTRKHFTAIAKALATTRPSGDAKRVAQWLRDVEAMANTCAETNPRFDRVRFVDACMV